MKKTVAEIVIRVGYPPPEGGRLINRSCWIYIASNWFITGGGGESGVPIATRSVFNGLRL